VVTLLALLSACSPSESPPAPAVPAVAPTRDVSGTVAATAAQPTLQAQPGARGSAPPAATAGVPPPTVVLDESFGSAPQGWPNQPLGTAWYADSAYRLQTREAGQFIVLDAPLTDIVNDVVLSARFRKTGGPPGGGYGLVVADQGPDPHDGVNQGGRFVALEAGDQGLVGAWQREDDRWIDLQPWTPSAAVHEGSAVNELMVRVQGQLLTLLVNGTQVAQVTTELADGRVGVFVGGDGNQVVLEHFTVALPAAAAAIRVGSIPTQAPELAATPTLVPTTQPRAPTKLPGQGDPSLIGARATEVAIRVPVPPGAVAITKPPPECAETSASTMGSRILCTVAQTTGRYTVPNALPGDVLAFYRTALPAAGWKIDAATSNFTGTIPGNQAHGSSTSASRRRIGSWLPSVPKTGESISSLGNCLTLIPAAMCYLAFAMAKFRPSSPA
jgi:hypothetical protein